MKCITGDKWLRVTGYWLMVTGLMLIAGCSSDSTRTGEQRTDNTASSLQVMPYVANYQEGGNLMRAVSAGYNLYTPTSDLAIGLFVCHGSDEPTTSLIRYNNGVWHSQAKVEANEPYTIYGYMPRRDPITATMTKNTSNVVMTLSNIDAVIADDVCFVTGVKDMEGNLWQGAFDYTGKSKNNYVRLLMDHLFASINFKFMVDEEYKTLRTIKLKSLTLTTPKASVNATVTLTPNTTDADPVTTVSYTVTPANTGTNTAMFFESLEGVDIADASITNAFCCFVPQNNVSKALTLITTYDVYDRYGNKIRENSTATNQLPSNLSAARGQRLTLDLKVIPTYLYQLSEKDLDNPTIIIE